jgi:hypothetical protein
MGRRYFYAGKNLFRTPFEKDFSSEGSGVDRKSDLGAS